MVPKERKKNYIMSWGFFWTSNIVNVLLNVYQGAFEEMT